MLERGHHDARPFGQRRAADGRDGGRDGWPTIDLAPEPAPRTGVLAWALRSVALTGFVAVFAAQYLVRVSGPVEAPSARIVLAARGPQGDPETTGSIGRSLAGAARSTRLDPCALAEGARPRP